MELVRLLPADYELPEISEDDQRSLREYYLPIIPGSERDFSAWFGGAIVKRGKNTSFEGASSEIQNIVTTFRDILDSLPSEFKNYISARVQGENEVLDLMQIIGAYSGFIEGRERLRLILHRANPDRERKITSHIHFGKAPGVLGMLSVDNDGFFRIVIDDLFKELDGEEAHRVRDCKVCGHIFWAGRITQKCCSPRCSNTFRVHRYRYKTDAEKAAYIDRQNRRERARIAKQERKSRHSRKGE